MGIKFGRSFLSIFRKEGSGITVEEHKAPQSTLIEGKDEVIVQGFQVVAKLMDNGSYRVSQQCFFGL